MTNDELIVEANEIRIVAKEDRSLALFMWNQSMGRENDPGACRRAGRASARRRGPAAGSHPEDRCLNDREGEIKDVP